MEKAERLYRPEEALLYGPDEASSVIELGVYHRRQCRTTLPLLCKKPKCAGALRAGFGA